MLCSNGDVEQAGGQRIGVIVPDVDHRPVGVRVPDPLNRTASDRGRWVHHYREKRARADVAGGSGADAGGVGPVAVDEQLEPRARAEDG